MTAFSRGLPFLLVLVIAELGSADIFSLIVGTGTTGRVGLPFVFHNTTFLFSQFLLVLGRPGVVPCQFSTRSRTDGSLLLRPTAYLLSTPCESETPLRRRVAHLRPAFLYVLCTDSIQCYSIAIAALYAMPSLSRDSNYLK
jgi:hypothetical protein